MSVTEGDTQETRQLGCTKCRYASKGCQRCRNPTFKPRTVPSDAAAPRKTRNVRNAWTGQSPRPQKARKLATMQGPGAINLGQERQQVPAAGMPGCYSGYSGSSYSLGSDQLQLQSPSTHSVHSVPRALAHVEEHGQPASEPARETSPQLPIISVEGSDGLAAWRRQTGTEDVSEPTSQEHMQDPNKTTADAAKRRQLFFEQLQGRMQAQRQARPSPLKACLSPLPRAATALQQPGSQQPEDQRLLTSAACPQPMEAGASVSARLHGPLAAGQCPERPGPSGMCLHRQGDIASGDVPPTSSGGMPLTEACTSSGSHGLNCKGLRMDGDESLQHPGHTPAITGKLSKGSPSDRRAALQAALLSPMHAVARRRQRAGGGGPRRQAELPRALASPAAGEGLQGTAADPRVSLWVPPASPYCLIEEVLYSNPWQLLLACMLLNKTSAKQVRKVLGELFQRWPTAEAMTRAQPTELEQLLKPLGLFRKRALSAIRFSHEYLTKQWRDPQELHGMGQYAADAYYMFCRGQWQELRPQDKDLFKYHTFLVETGGEGMGLEREAGLLAHSAAPGADTIMALTSGDETSGSSVEAAMAAESLSECTAEHSALLKILFHAAKYPHASVNGILLGSAASVGAVSITDAIPLFHNSMELAGPTELALGQVETYAQGSGRPQVVGYYHSDSRFAASDMSPLARRLADRIAERHSAAVVLLLDNKKLASFLQEGVEGSSHPFELFSQDGRSWKREQQSKLVMKGPKDVRDKFLNAVQDQSYRELHDFDEHLDDLSKDFLNPGLFSSK